MVKAVIIGGVAGGASCAARLRRLDEDAQILMVERGPYVSYANCGLPYHVGDVIVGRNSRVRGTQGIAIIGFFGGVDRRHRKDTRSHRRQGFREGLPVPEFPRGLLSGGPGRSR